MDHQFELSVIFKGEELSLNARLAAFGYSYKFFVEVAGRAIIFEKDDEGEYRALTDAADTATDKDLLQAIVTALEKIQQ